ncbi:MAG: hypothetical protein WA432_04890 [Candidatus Babeliaceae bacterium]
MNNSTIGKNLMVIGFITFLSGINAHADFEQNPQQDTIEYIKNSWIDIGKQMAITTGVTVGGIVLSNMLNNNIANLLILCGAFKLNHDLTILAGVNPAHRSFLVQFLGFLLGLSFGDFCLGTTFKKMLNCEVNLKK